MLSPLPHCVRGEMSEDAMRPYLVFHLEAPLASFGSIAVGERRATWDRPSRSQIVGFLAAALGVERRDARQKALADAIAFGVRVDDAGVLIQDFHTVQQPEGPAVRRRIRAGGTIATRADELDFGPEDLETKLSRREYRRDAAYTVAVWLSAPCFVTLDDLGRALRTPAFHLAAGRKANALMFPCAPLVTPPLADLLAAFEAYDASDSRYRSFRDAWSPAWLVEKRNGAERTVFADDGADLAPETAIIRREQRRDVPHTRHAWQFLQRNELVIHLPPAKERLP